MKKYSVATAVAVAFAVVGIVLILVSVFTDCGRWVLFAALACCLVGNAVNLVANLVKNKSKK